MSPALDAVQLQAILTQKVFAPLLADHWLDDLAGRLATTGVTFLDVCRAAEDFALKRTGDGLEGDKLVRAFAGYVGAEKRRRQAVAAKERPLEEAEQVALDMWRELWAKAHGGATYAISGKDPDYIRAITARAKGRASELGNLVRGREVLRHYFSRYLAIDDKGLVKKRYPLSLLDAHMPAIGEYELPRPKPPAPPPSDPGTAAPPEHKQSLPDMSGMLRAAQEKNGGRLVARARA
ncbi:hypothetical protein [Sorangium sp. So ce1024]|uniref:hypothetical protein n=1 Tax=Sorangium sp. So ce1024 TaxID=3133327 RepID=UPI003F0634F4